MSFSRGNGDFHLCFRVGIHDLERRQAKLFENAGRMSTPR